MLPAGASSRVISVVGGAFKDASFWYLAGGISQNYFGIGKTVLFGEYSESKEWRLERARWHDHYVNADGSYTVTHWGLGVTQHFDAAALELFITYKNYSIDAPTARIAGPQDFSAFITGTKMSF